MTVLGIIPCGRAKIWDRFPKRGAVPARFAYIGAPFILNKQYVERMTNRWVILSAKYGFISPDFLIPGPYDVTFKDPRTLPVSIEALRQQICQLDILDYTRVLCLGGKEYRAIVTRAFHPVKIEFPFAGLKVGQTMKAIKQQLQQGSFGFGFSKRTDK